MIYSNVLDSALVAKEAMELITRMIFSESCDMTLLAQRLTELKALLIQLKNTINGGGKQFAANQITSITNNLVHNIDIAVECTLKSQLGELQFIYEYYLYTLFMVTMNEYIMCCALKADKEKYPEFYAEKVFDKKAVRSDENRLCKVSIVLLAYNKVEYTKKAVESILKYTEDIECELILVNNGSTDETQEYFDSIQGAVAIHLKENINASPGFNVGFFAAKGKYIAGVCNDFIFTENWLKNLLICMESDENIGFVSPVSSFISNLQQVELSFSNDEQMQKQAKKYNVSSPQKWERRTRLLPNVLMCPTDLIQGLNGYAQEFVYGEFADDDISYRIHKAGFAQVLCRDTWVHHFGHITTQKAQVESNSLQVSQQIFKSKWGFDAWEDLMPDYQLAMSCEVVPSQVKGKHVRILGVNTVIGGTALVLKERILQYGAAKVDIYHITTENKFISAYKTVYVEELLLDDFSHCQSAFDDTLFDFVILGKDLTKSDFAQDFFLTMKNKINKAGVMACSVKNSSYLMNVIDIIYQRVGTSDAPSAKIYGLESLCNSLSQIGFTNSVTPMRDDRHLDAAKAIAKMLQAPLSVEKGLTVARYIVNSQAF